MEPRIIKLDSLCDMGSGTAEVYARGVRVQIAGINGCLKVWLTGEECTSIGNLVDGRLEKEIDTAPYSGVLVTQSGRQMFYGSFGEGSVAPPPPESKPALPRDFSWKKITARTFPTTNATMKYILSNRRVFRAVQKHGYYYFGTRDGALAVALPHAPGEESPFPRGRDIDGYSVVTVDIS